MPATSGKTGIGTLLKMGDGNSPEVFATVANVVSMEVGGVTLETVDATHLNSSDNYREILPTLKAGDPWNVTLQWNPEEATHDGLTGLRKKAEDRALTTFRVDTSALGLDEGIEADCYVTNLGNISFTVDGLMSQTCTLTPSGKPRPYDQS